MGNYLGTCNIRSNYSKDGILSIPELAKIFKAKNFNFICIADNNIDKDGKYLSQKTLEELSSECEKYSNDTFLIIPGIKYTTIEAWEVLGIGVTKPIESKKWEIIVSEVKAHGGIAVLSSPNMYKNRYPEKFLETIDGIEVWTGKNNYPDMKAVRSVRKSLEFGFGVTAFYGQNFSHPSDISNMGMIISEDMLTRRSVITALGAKGYILRSQFQEVGPDVGFQKVFEIYAGFAGYINYYGFGMLKFVDKLLVDIGFGSPEFLKKLLKNK